MVVIIFARLRQADQIQETFKSGDIAGAKKLLAEKPAVVFRKYKGLMPLHWAVISGRKDLVEMLLANKADVNGKSSDDATPLHVAAQNGHKDIAELLLGYGAEVDPKNDFGQTPLYLAASNGHKEITEFLLIHGAEIKSKDNGGYTPLHIAVWHRQKEVVELLLSKGADVNTKNDVGHTPWDDAMGNNYQEIAELLVTKLSDDDLAKLVMDGKTTSIRRTALGALTGQASLMQFATMLPAAELRMIAVEKVTDQKFLLARSREDPSAAVRTASVKAMKSADTLLDVAINSYYGDLREAAAARISNVKIFDDDERLHFLSELSAANKIRDQQVAALVTQSDSQALVDTALNGRFDTVCLAAAKRLFQQPLLATVAMRTTDREVAKTVLARLTDADLLSQVAGTADDAAVRIAAAVAQKKTSWQEVFAKASKAGDSKSLGDALAAVSLLASQTGIKDFVTEACLTLIRRGDESRIPEMADLLNNYGDKPLCEDYLNSGQPDLNNAGVDWARNHGFSIDKGYGSHRATWGSAK